MKRLEKNKERKDMYQVKQILAKNLRLLRNIKGESQENIARVLHVSRSCYNYLESGAHTPDFNTLCQLSAYYNVSLDYLLTFDISEHIMSIMRKKKSERDALRFLNRYMQLSHGGRSQIRKRLEELKAVEDKYTIFPWDYENNETEVK